MKVAVVGGNGQLGCDVVAAFSQHGEQVVSLSHADLDVERIESLRESLTVLGPSIIVNTAAMHHVEKCETDPLRAYEINALGARNLAILARELSAKLIHISTDYVFDGRKHTPYLENDIPAPLNIYGNTKLAGEAFIRGTWPRHFILRTSALYGKNPCRAKGGLNFVQLMLKLATERGRVRVVDDEIVSPTFTPELARQIVALSQTQEYGLYHATAEGSCSWYRFAQEIFNLTQTKVHLEVAAGNEFPAKIPRPKFSVLENQQLKELKLNVFRSWEDGLRAYLFDDQSILPVLPEGIGAA